MAKQTTLLPATEPQPSSEAKPPKEQKKIGKLIVLQRIERLLGQLPSNERNAVMAFLAEEHGWERPKPVKLIECRAPGY